ncbi:mate-domain-containing protein [Syncephalis plumigaleata]|nr:mate-domain-containing protein [Syncephalis plumigaleata]
MVNNNNARHKPVRPTEETSLLVNLNDTTSSIGLESRNVSLHEVKKESLWLLRNGSPISLTLLLQASTNISAVMCIGHLGPSCKYYLAAAAISGAFITLSCTSWLLGMVTALDTLCSQTFTAGSRNSKLLSLHIQRALVVLLLCFIPMACLCLNAESVLLYLGQDPEVARLSGKYVFWLLLHIPGFIVIDVFRRFFQGQGDMKTGARILCITGPIGAILNYILIIVCRDSIGFIGAPVASLVSNTLGAILIVYKAVSQPTWSPWTYAAFSGWKPFLKLAISGIFLGCNELWIVEILTLIASYFGPIAVTVQAITIQCAMVSLLIHLGVAIAASNRIGNLLGAGKSILARVNAWTSFTIVVLLACTYAALVFIFRKKMGSFYTNDEEVIRLVGELLPIGAFFHVIVAIGVVCDAILRGQGQQSYGATIRIVTFYLVGLPLAILLSIHTELRLAGLWLAFISAVLLTVVSEIVLIAKCNWEQISITSQQDVRRAEAKLNQTIVVEPTVASSPPSPPSSPSESTTLVNSLEFPIISET